MTDTTKRIIYTNSEGGLTILLPAKKCPLTIEEVAKKDVPSGTTYHIIDAADVPSDRSFRDAWTYTP
tara:strand:+ start:170 stop:370 length:201 start_codon:yes stop_codon:yes gene_type:complete